MQTSHPSDDRPAATPLLDLPARLGWQARYAWICFADPPYVILQATLIFPLCHPELFARDIVCDSFSLLDSLERPGAHWILTSTCGIADDAGLEAPIFVSHPYRQQIVWEVDLKGLAPALDDSLNDKDGFIRLTFERCQYEAELRALVCELRERAINPVPIEAMSETYGVEALQREYSHLAPFQVDELEPSIGGMALERLLDLDLDNLPDPSPLWSAGTLIEFGFFEVDDGHDLIRVNGAVPRPLSWPPRYFTRWEAWRAFHRWVDFIQRGFWLGHHGCVVPPRSEQNRFFLLQESHRALCHAAGRHLAEVVQRDYQEGETAPGVMVRYAECPLDVAERKN
ncbi:hypothetical protein Thiowin_04063 [Thiorhodovibrio winogradskyi]|uniref:Uncharacterized protein n=1 Tax=Thiorhodovibrio winogradskyi TaxID=77007 RepID=A0ABZ0SE99_9GAMM|nr:hypothetical protein [Thiorhodovibrio winogradskyi]